MADHNELGKEGEEFAQKYQRRFLKVPPPEKVLQATFLNMVQLVLHRFYQSQLPEKEY